MMINRTSNCSKNFVEISIKINQFQAKLIVQIPVREINFIITYYDYQYVNTFTKMN
ncbi:hypothetical protein METHB2_340023 [Candidatus Methylobacter favarea]|uniref:Uncharacterized protein n=1 Tax=Candidatus Methylobacter favarea TaxID=2707345 RepID=A0A8S0WPW1_9GAMM|nr:hypothetical protein METHB2_340023 [Candidatus Methylobacter favarea]